MKTVLVTGSNRGIGKQIALDFARAGYRVIAHARKQSDESAGCVAELCSTGAEIIPVYFDMTDTAAMKTAVKQLYSEKIIADVLVNCAGIAHGGLFAMTTTETIKQVFEVNLFSCMELTRLVMRGMMKQRSGAIINMASIAGSDLHEGNSAYGVSKAAVIAWTKTLAAELAQYNIRVNSISPGLTDTDMAKQMEAKAERQMLGESAMKRLARPDEISQVALFLASDAASFVNGQNIRVDGGGGGKICF